MLLRKTTLAKLFGPEVPDRHLVGFAIVLNQSRRGETFAQEPHRAIRASGSHHGPARLQRRFSPSSSPRLASRSRLWGRNSREEPVGTGASYLPHCVGLSYGLAQRHGQRMSQSSVQGEKEAKYTPKRGGDKWIHQPCLPRSSGNGVEQGNHTKPC